MALRVPGNSGKQLQAQCQSGLQGLCPSLGHLRGGPSQPCSKSRWTQRWQAGTMALVLLFLGSPRRLLARALGCWQQADCGKAAGRLPLPIAGPQRLHRAPLWPDLGPSSGTGHGSASPHLPPPQMLLALQAGCLWQEGRYPWRVLLPPKRRAAQPRQGGGRGQNAGSQEGGPSEPPCLGSGGAGPSCRP